MPEENLFEFMKHVTRGNTRYHAMSRVREDLEDCLKKARALRDEPLLEPEQRKLVNEICDTLAMIESAL